MILMIMFLLKHYLPLERKKTSASIFFKLSCNCFQVLMRIVLMQTKHYLKSFEIVSFKVKKPGRKKLFSFDFILAAI